MSRSDSRREVDTDATAFVLIVESEAYGTLHFGPIRSYAKAEQLAKRVESNGMDNWSIESLQPHRWLAEWGWFKEDR